MTTKRVVLGCIAMIYGFCIVMLPHAPVFWSPDEGGKYLDLLRIISQKKLFGSLSYPGRLLDPDLDYVPLLYYLIRDSELYSWWPSWFPAIAAPFYQLGGVSGIYLLPLISGLCISLMVGVALSSISRHLSWTAAILTALGSPIWFYSLTFWEHTLHTLLIFLACMMVAKAWQRHNAQVYVFRPYALAGICLGLAFYLRLETLIFAAALALTCFIARGDPSGIRVIGWPEREAVKRFLVLSGCCLVVVMPYLTLNYIQTGHLLGRRYSGLYRERTSVDYPEVQHPGVLQTVPNLIVGTSRHQGFDLRAGFRWLFVLSWLVCLVWPVVGIDKFSPIGFLSIFFVVMFCGAALFERRSYTSLHGLGFAAPWMIFSTWMARTKSEVGIRFWGVLTGLACSAFLAASFLLGWEGQGGLQWGPRYALPLFPLLAICTALGLQKVWWIDTESTFRRALMRSAYVILILLGIGLQIRGIVGMVDHRRTYTIWESEALAYPDETVLSTPLEWLALTIPRVYTLRVMHFVDEDQPLSAIWEQQAYRRGYRQICSYIPGLPRPLRCNLIQSD